MSRELYFLRSSEQKIVVDMFKLAHPNKDDELLKYTEHYGLSPKDLGVYALVDGEIAGAIWSRKFEGESAATLSLGVVAKFENSEVDSFLMHQFLEEASAVFDALVVEINEEDKRRDFYELHGFTQIQNEKLLEKKLQKKEVVRPSDGYDPSKWMD